MKKFILVLIALVIILSGCAEGAPAALNASKPPTNRGQQALLTDNAFEDYGITGEIEVYDPETYTLTKYSGEVSGEAARELWELLRVIEGPSITLKGEQTVGGGDCIGGSLIFTNKKTGESSMVYDGILYEAPELCGGSPVIIIGGRYYGDGYLDEYGVTASEKIEELLIKGVAREENVVERKDCKPADTWADKPERLTDMNFEELEFSGAADVYDSETRFSTAYRGDIAGEACKELWKLLGELEECEPVELGENGSVGGCFDGHLMITNAVTGDEYFITDGIYYSDPMLCGGPTVVVVRGRFRDSSNEKYYFPTYDENGVSLFDKLTGVLCGAIACEENVYCRVQTYPTEPEVIEKKDIVMVRSYCNYAWGYQHYGEFVDISGNIYGFDFSEEQVGSDEEFIKLLEDGHFNGRFGEPTLTVGNIDALREIVDLADHVAEDAKIAEKHEAYDAGQTTLYAVTSEHTLVEIYSEGDFRRINTDENALRISAICKKNNIF